MAYSVVYQTDDRTLTEAEAIRIREKITKLAERELGGALRS
jgi:phenylalanyl-tRNA synthetase beta subunit